MNALVRFFSAGSQNADRRVAAALAPQPLDGADRYLQSSAIVMAVDRVTRGLRDWWLASEARHLVASVGGSVLNAPWTSRYHAVATILLIAVAVNVVMTVIQGARAGWFWMVIPAMAALFAAVLLAASRSSKLTQ